MVSAQKEGLTLRRATVAEVLPLIARAAPFSVDDEPADPRQIAENGNRFVFTESGVPVFGFVLEAVGNDAYITAAGATGRHDFTHIGLAAIEGMARGAFEAVAFSTRRGGLIRKARRRGYAIAGPDGSGWILRKALK